METFAQGFYDIHVKTKEKKVKKVKREHLKYFSENYITAEAISWLKRSRKELAYGKVVEFENDVIELYDFEKPVFVKMRNDSLLGEIENLSEGLYNFYELSKELREYMKSKDNLFFNKAYREWLRSKEENIPIRRELEVVDSIEVSPEEFMEFWNGRKRLHVTPTWKKLNDSTRRTYKTVNDLIRANLDVLDVFATLTFARKENAEKYKEKYNYEFDYINSSKDFDEVKTAFSNFVNSLRKKIKRTGKDLYYITVYERHKDGSYHFHMLMNDIGREYLEECPEWLDLDYKTKKRRHGLILSDWTHGKSDYETIQDKNRMASYLCKYLTKTILNLANDEATAETLLGAKRYFSSKNLKRPTVTYRDDVGALIEAKKIEYADTYSTEYRNYYNNGKIKKVILSNPDLLNYNRYKHKIILEKKSIDFY